VLVDSDIVFEGRKGSLGGWKSVWMYEEGCYQSLSLYYLFFYVLKKIHNNKKRKILLKLANRQQVVKMQGGWLKCRLVVFTPIQGWTYFIKKFYYNQKPKTKTCCLSSKHHNIISKYFIKLSITSYELPYPVNIFYCQRITQLLTEEVVHNVEYIRISKSVEAIPIFPSWQSPFNHRL